MANQTPKARVIALYLPQFHPIPENDAWWGKGFTEWTNVGKAKPLFKGHYQPRVPLNNNYYDLSAAQPLYEQAALANKYDIYGFCFYHYWFNGKLLLEKPSQNILKNPDIELNYCFSWANEPWTRTWDGKNRDVLMPQEYGDEQDWLRHFNYLLPFFQDKRYIKEHNCPMFLIYKSQSIPNCKEMMDKWNNWAIEKGFDGIHFVETLRTGGVDSRELPYKARVEFEPARTNFQQSYFVLNYNRIRRRIIYAFNKIFKTSIPLNKPFDFSVVATRSINLKSPKGTYGGVFVGWDNTARKKLAGTVIYSPTKIEFKNYVKEKLRITIKEYNTNYLFVNAWNEWCEGAYLEPDEVNKYAYLEAIKEVLEQDVK